MNTYQNKRNLFFETLGSTSLSGFILMLEPLVYLLFSRRRDLSQYNSIDGSAIVFIIYVFIAFFVGCNAVFKSNITKQCNLVIKKSPIVWFAYYMVLAIISMLWSVNPILTGYRAFECFAMLFLIIAVVIELFEKGGIELFLRWTIIYVLWGIIMSIIRTLNYTSALSIILESSQMLSTTFFFMALYQLRKQWYSIFIMIMAIFSMSTVSYIGMALGSISLLWLRGKKKMLGVIFFFIISMVIIYIGPYNLLKETIFFDKQDISIEETSGRDHLMNVTLETVEHYPFGQGFFAAEPYVLYQSFNGAINAHNSLFSAALGLGYPGIVLFSVFLIALFITTFSKWIDSKIKAICIGSMMVAFLQCMGNPSVGSRIYGAWIPCMYVFVMISVCYVRGKYMTHHYKYRRTLSD